MRTLLLLVLTVAAALPIHSVRAQANPPSDPEAIETNTAYYSFLRPGEVPIEVFVLGEVRAPGIYAVGLGMKLDQLLALSGGMAEAGSERTERVVTVRLYHEVNGQRNLVFEQPLENVLTGIPQPPPLEAWDVVTVEAKEQRQWLTFDNFVRVVSAGASIFLVFDRLIR